MSSDVEYMQRAIRLARNGVFTADPNPCVGSVIVKDGEVVGEGWHQCAGEPHAVFVEQLDDHWNAAGPARGGDHRHQRLIVGRALKAGFDFGGENDDPGRGIEVCLIENADLKRVAWQRKNLTVQAGIGHRQTSG